MNQRRKLGLVISICLLSTTGPAAAKLFEANSPISAQPAAALEIDPLAIDTAIRSLLDENVDRGLPREMRTRSLHEFLFTPDHLGIVYDASKTKTAQETFDTGSGNCLSLAHLFVAAARHLGLDAHYQRVEVPRLWTRVNGFYSISGHVNVIVRMPGHERAVVELVAATFPSAVTERVISDRQALASHYSNLGAEALMKRDDESSVAYLGKATELDPDLRLAWSNLGVLYRLTDRFEDAEAAYLKALKLDRRNPTSIQNIHSLYKAWDRPDKAEKYQKQALRFARENPYYIARTAQMALESGQLKQAKQLYKKAIRAQPQEEEFYLGLARVYLELDAMHKASEAIVHALEVSTTSEAQRLYQRKLATLSRLTEGG